MKTGIFMPNVCYLNHCSQYNGRKDDDQKPWLHPLDHKNNLSSLLPTLSILISFFQMPGPLFFY